MSTPVTPPSLIVAIVLTLLVAYGPIATDLYLPSLPGMVSVFGATVSQVQLTLSVYMWGFAIAQLIYGPLSDRFGRRPVLLVGIVIFCAASLACVGSDTIEELIAGRFFQALGACAGPVIGRAIVRDLYGQEQAAKVLAYMGSAMALVPAVAPILGGWIEVSFGWQGQFVVLLIFGALTWIAAWGVLAESNQHMQRYATHPSRIAKNFRTLMADRRFMGFTLVISFAMATLFSFISGAAFILIDIIGLSPQQFGYAFVGPVMGYLCGSLFSGRVVHLFGFVAILRVGIYIALVSACALLVCAILGWQTLWAVVLPASLCFIGIGMVLPNGLAGAIGPYPRIAGSASSLLGFLQMGTGAFAGAMVGLLHSGTTLATVAIMFTGSLLSFLSYWFLLQPEATLKPEDQ